MAEPRLLRRASTSFWHPPKKKEKEGRKEKKRKSWQQLQIYATHKLAAKKKQKQKTLISRWCCTITTGERCTATAGPAGHSEELDCCQCGGGTKEKKGEKITLVGN